MNPDIEPVPDYKANAFDYLTTAVVVLDASQRVCAMNQAAEDLFGVSEQRATGANLRDYLQEDAHIGFASLSQLFLSRQPVTRRGAIITMRDGLQIKADVTIGFDPIGGNAIIELAPLNRLLRINREDQVLSSRKTVQALTRGLAHEVKNPLGGLRGAAQLLEKELAAYPALQEYTQVIINEADRLSSLVDRMLGPNQQPHLQAVNVHKVLEHVIRLIDAEMPDRITFNRDYDPSLPELIADEAQLIQAILNILRNAAEMFEESTTSNPTVLLRTRIVRSFTIGNQRHRLVVQIDIVDNGPGIDEDLQQRIFFPMISNRVGGTGLGLAITQNIVGQHRGVIECESEPGNTCFTVFLPVEAPENE
jgi:two-component system nitrogen regulation sensor histidine kinase GlnL